MGQARQRGTFEQRKAEAISAGRIKKARPRKILTEPGQEIPGDWLGILSMARRFIDRGKGVRLDAKRKRQRKRQQEKR